MEQNRSQSQLKRADWLEWKHHPVTRAYLQTVKQEVDDLKEALASGATVHTDNAIETAMMTMQMVTKIAQLRNILAINEADLDDEV